MDSPRTAMESITKSLGDKFIEKFKIFPEQTLFDIDIRVAIEKHRCPYCFNKLKFPLKGNIALCNSKKHGKPFLISINKLNAIL